MAGNRKAFTDYVADELKKILPNNNSHVFVKKKLLSLSDKEFEDMVVRIENAEFYIPYYISNSNNHKIDLPRLLKLSTSLGFDAFNNLVVEDAQTGQVYQTEVQYWVCMLPCRRQVQYLLSKTSIAKDNKSRDVMTGQVAGASKSSTLSAPQLAGVLGRGCISNALELSKFRGGDISGGRALLSQLINTGGASMEPLLLNNTKPTVRNTVASQLNACHLQNTL